MIENLSLLGGLIAGNVALAGCVVYLTKNYFSDKKNGNTPSSNPCATPTDVDDVHERVNEVINHCSNFRESCLKQNNEFQKEVLQRLTRIETSLNGKSRSN